MTHLYLYPKNLAEKASMWLWELKDLAVIGISVLLSIVILTQTKLMLPLVASALYAFLSMRFDGTSILDFIKYAAIYFFLKPQLYEWRPRDEETE